MTESAQAAATSSDESRPLRRRSTIVAGFIFASIFIAAGIGLTPGEVGHGFLSTIAPLCTAVPLALLVLVFLVWPHVVIRDEQVEVHNSFVTYDVPYRAVDDLRQNRMGLVVKTIAGKTIPVTAYTSGSAGRMMNHKEQADEVIRQVRNKMEFKRAGENEDLPPVRRRVNVLTVVLVLASLAAGVLVVVGAAHTYHS
jgi:hypothetical protein